MTMQAQGGLNRSADEARGGSHTVLPHTKHQRIAPKTKKDKTNSIATMRRRHFHMDLHAEGSSKGRLRYMKLPGHMVRNHEDRVPFPEHYSHP
jgi:hypothetical protein